MDAELAAALTMFDNGDPADLEGERRRLRKLRDSNPPHVPDSIRVRDVQPSETDGPPVRLRLYEPRASGTLLPALLWFHGGAFAYGFPEIDDDLCVRLAVDSGFLIVAPDYRLSPEYQFPVGFNDCYESVLWVAKYSDFLGINRDFLTVGGSSAGGALAAGVCQRARDENGPVIKQQILACPVIDDRLTTRSMHEFQTAPIFNPNEARLMWDRYLGKNREDPPPYAVPGRHQDLSNLPPAYIMTADFDPLRDEGIDYALRLLAAGNAVELHHLPETFHSFDSIVPTAGISQRIYKDYVAALLRSISDFGYQVTSKEKN
jgi:acetyl esterase/lipase